MVSEARPTFASENSEKFLLLMKVLDWPFSMLGSASLDGLDGRTSSYAACAAVNMWVVVVIGFILPSYLILVGLTDPFHARNALWLKRDGAFLLFCTAQGLWCIIRALTVVRQW